ncbi:MAG: DUF1475 domain-containing protein [Nevskiaceae bacterium]|nr:MAG: DUF1475 domain-containing protein [Nevskiaceae bacterium]TAM24723.1 MAG: DUF1475 domain-containing protein [Nevskiaceae bacterium]
MKLAIAVTAVAALLVLIAVSVWASSLQGIVPAIRDLLARPAAGNHPWFIATLADAYFGFLWFWLWVAYREVRWTSRLGWLVLILGLGNMAMAAYALLTLLRLPRGAGVEQFLLRPRRTVD